MNQAARNKDIQERFASLGFEAEPGPPGALAKRNALETIKWAKAIKDAGIEQQ